MATKEEVLKAIKGSDLYKALHSPTNEIDREDIEEGVNSTGQATDRLMALQRLIKSETMLETDFPKELIRDADKLQEMIQTAIVTLYADSEDGQISSADFKKFHDPLAGMVEGLLSALRVEDPEIVVRLRTMKQECAEKAFMRQLKRLFESGRSQGRVGLFQLAKALSSLQTHTFIEAERSGGLCDGLARKVAGLLESLSAKARGGVWDFFDELKEVKGWGLVEAGEANDGEKRWDGKAAKGEEGPPGTVKAPGDPEDTPDGEEPKQKPTKAKLPKKIDGQPVASEEKKESVRFDLASPVEGDRPGDRRWAARIGEKVVARARKTKKITRHGGRVAKVPAFETELDIVGLMAALGLESAKGLELPEVASLPEFKGAVARLVEEARR